MNDVEVRCLLFSQVVRVPSITREDDKIVPLYSSLKDYVISKAFSNSHTSERNRAPSYNL